MSPSMLRNVFRHKFTILSAAAIISTGVASASVVGIYGGIDTGVGPGGTYTNSSAAQAQFWAALGVNSPTITFEGVPSLASLGSGVSATIINGGVDNNNVPSGIETQDMHTPEPLGFNVTPNGNAWLRLIPQFNSSGASVQFNFSSAINAFGFWITDSQSDLPGPITVTFNDGTAETLNVTKNGADASGNYSGGTLYYGFITNSPFSSVSISTGPTTNKRDVWGIDNITLGDVVEPAGVPEPSTWSLLLGAALVGIGLKSRSR